MPTDHEFAEHYKPYLVMYPEHTKEGGVDYHPRDIRLVLAQVRFRLHRGTGADVIPKLVRSWPAKFVALIGIMGAAWGAALGFFAQNSDPLREPLVWIAILLAAAATALIVKLLVGHAVPLVPRDRLVQNMGFAGGLLASLLLQDILGSAELNAGSRLYRMLFAGAATYGAAWTLAFLGMCARDFMLKRHPEANLAAITEESGMEPSKAKRLFLVYGGVGAPADRDKHREAYIAMNKPGQDDVYPRTLYAHVTRGKGELSHCIAIQYWMAYFYNDWENTHEMDWEQITVFVRTSNDRDDYGSADLCGYSIHTGGVWADWETQVIKDGTHPIVHVARGSHANYVRPGKHRTYLRVGTLELSPKEIPLFGQGSMNGYIDDAPGLDDDGAKRYSTEFKVVVIPHGTKTSVTSPKGKGPTVTWLWEHQHAGECNIDSSGLCEQDFRWMNIKGSWGAPGGLFGDGAPVSPCENAAWDAFRWLEGCPQLRESEALARLRPIAGNGYQPGLRTHVSSTTP
jgi:hypothetical protein